MARLDTPRAARSAAAHAIATAHLRSAHAHPRNYLPLTTYYYLLGSTALSGSLPRAVIAHAAGLWELELPAAAAAAVPLPPLSPLAPLLVRRFKPFSYGWGGRLTSTRERLMVCAGGTWPPCANELGRPVRGAPKARQLERGT